ncbi:hypothetical protein ETAA8_37280 [Anatilimnocola aggregata]|uniref:BIG2 domain-containing protein n=1 Tax=Anatilimnocola aggregata TaxID=2528021 RepID=A0A517YEG1_9BACT|nr:DUF1549 domain-containing protein [Anatilimnocola aggregata]QDU28625.1 hypothetical protein ETAA8_37280 [Anatilimnocola aggregata]
MMLGPMKQRLLFAALICCLPLLTTANAADVVPSVVTRFAAATGDEEPSLRRHVLPLMGRLGCNGRACHGSFQGQGGFRLSLFGYDFAADHAAVVGGDEPRTNLKQPDESLILQKPLLVIDHDGGKRFEKGSWQHHLLLRWVTAGAKTVAEDEAEITHLEISPREIVFAKKGETAQIKVMAHWSDGAREDVTPICRFRSNDESMATIDEAGLVTALGPGDTAVVAFYDNGVLPVQVLLPVTDQLGDKYPAVPTPTKIDELVVAKLSKLGVVPSELCTDTEFLRRVSLDLIGTLPAPGEIDSFLADTSADKRNRKIDELLSRPAYAAWWATKLSDLTGNTSALGPQGGEQGLNGVKARQWHAWITRRVEQNVPYDKLVEGIVLAVSRSPDQPFLDYTAEMSSYFRGTEPADFAERETMPYYWTRRQLGSPSAKALAFAYSFLGVSLQCAECHKHPYDQWTKQDFDQFAVFFNGVRYGAFSRDETTAMKKEHGLTMDEDSGDFKRLFVTLLAEGKTLPFKELTVPRPSKNPKLSKPRPDKAGRVITPRVLGGEEVLTSEYPDPRQPLMDWMRQEDNPYFAKAFVNRVWAGYFHIGLIDPPDDLNLANPPSNPALLDYLADEFIRQKYDMKWLHREITRSRTYQLSCRPNRTNENDERNYSRAVIRRLPAEVTYDALAYATASDETRASLDAKPATLRAIGEVSGLNGRDAGASSYAVNLFGKPPRAINCDCERSAEPNLLQLVYLRNDNEIDSLLDRKDGWLQKLRDSQPSKRSKIANAKPLDHEALVREAYFRTLCRLPSEQEEKIALGTLSSAADPITGLRDLMWALLNTKEFIVNR